MALLDICKNCILIEDWNDNNETRYDRILLHETIIYL